MDHDFIVSGSFTPYGTDSLEQCALTGNAFVVHATCAASIKILSDFMKTWFYFCFLVFF